jgi:outer membrane protein assembly factor BamA
MSLRGFESSGIGPRSYTNYDHSAIAYNSNNNNHDSNGIIDNKNDHNNGSLIPSSSTGAGSHTRNRQLHARLGDSLGGNSRSSLLIGLSVPCPIPVLANSQMRAFLFCNMGSIGRNHLMHATNNHNSDNNGDSNNNNHNSNSNNSDNPFQSSSYSLPWFGYVRVSLGGGILVHLSERVRFESTYSIPVVRADHDNIRPFQIGVGLTFT